MILAHIKHLHCVRHRGKHFMYIILFNPYSLVSRDMLFPSHCSAFTVEYSILDWVLFREVNWNGTGMAKAESDYVHSLPIKIKFHSESYY